MSIPLPPIPGGPGGPPGGPGGPPPGPPTGLQLFQMIPQTLLAPDWGQLLQGSYPQQDPPPDLQTIQTRADDLQQLWNPRDNRMDSDDDLYNMTDASNAEATTIVRNIITTTVEKVANMMGAHIPHMRTIPPHLDLQHIAKKADDFHEFSWEEWDRRWRAGGHSALLHDAAHYLAHRGWLTMRISYDDQYQADELPTHLHLADPRNVYPAFGDEEVLYVIHRKYMFAGEIVSAFPDAAQLLQGRQYSERLEIIAYYDKTYHAVLVDGNMIKPPTPHNYGFNPWVIYMAGGTPARGSGQQGAGTDWTANVGPPIYASIRQAYKNQNRLFTQISDSVAMASNPPVAVSYNPEKGPPETISLSPGATNYLVTGENLNVLQTKIPAEAAALINALNDDIYMGSVPKVLWGNADPQQSGYSIAILSGAARDALFGIIKALESAVLEINRKNITILRDLHTQPVGIVAKDENGNFVGGEVLTPQELRQIGTRMKVEYLDVTPKDEMARANLGIALAKSSLLSMDTVRSRYVGISNPDRENSKVVDELVYKDPQMMKDLFVPLSLYRYDPNMFQLWLLLQQFQMQQFMQQQAGGPGGPPGLGGPPGPQGSPSLAAFAGAPPVPGQPPTLVPPQLGAAPFNALQHAQASQQGGAGFQRPPGLSGIGGQLPIGLPPR